MLQPQPDVINRQQSGESDQAIDIEHEYDDTLLRKSDLDMGIT